MDEAVFKNLSKPAEVGRLNIALAQAHEDVLTLRAGVDRNTRDVKALLPRVDRLVANEKTTVSRLDNHQARLEDLESKTRSLFRGARDVFLLDKTRVEALMAALALVPEIVGTPEETALIAAHDAYVLGIETFEDSVNAAYP